MIQGIGLLLGFQLAGEVVARLLHISIPGPIIGLVLLFAWLQARAFTDLKTPEAIDTTEVAQVTAPLLRNLAILFVPSGVGVMEYFDLFTRHGPAVLLVLAASTLVTMAVTALAFVASQSVAAWMRVAQSKYQRADSCGSSVLRRSVKSPIVSPERGNG
jgi:holin-like protein